MPFIVKQGTDSDEGAKEEYPDLFAENLKRGGYLSRGASEDLALKVYFVSTPGPFDKNSERTVSRSSLRSRYGTRAGNNFP